jgi:hypothetical protein
MRPVRQLLAAPLLALLLLAMPAAGDDFGRQLPVAEGERLRVSLERGHVEVVRHDDAVVRLVARARGEGSEGVTFQLLREDEGLVFRGAAEPWLAWLRVGPRVEVRIWAPHDLDLEIETSGRVERHAPGVRVTYPATRAP